MENAHCDHWYANFNDSTFRRRIFHLWIFTFIPHERIQFFCDQHSTSQCSRSNVCVSFATKRKFHPNKLLYQDIKTQFTKVSFSFLFHIIQTTFEIRKKKRKKQRTLDATHSKLSFTMHSLYKSTASPTFISRCFFVFR